MNASLVYGIFIPVWQMESKLFSVLEALNIRISRIYLNWYDAVSVTGSILHLRAIVVDKHPWSWICCSIERAWLPNLDRPSFNFFQTPTDILCPYLHGTSKQTSYHISNVSKLLIMYKISLEIRCLLLINRMVQIAVGFVRYLDMLNCKQSSL
jgi:hypothetical protein